MVEGGKGKRRIVEHVAEKGIDIVLIASEGSRVKADLAGGFGVVFVVVTLMREEGNGDVCRGVFDAIFGGPVLDLEFVAAATKRIQEERANLEGVNLACVGRKLGGPVEVGNHDALFDLRERGTIESRGGGVAMDEEFKPRNEDTKGIDDILHVYAVGVSGAAAEGTTEDGGHLVAMGEVGEFRVKKGEGLGVLFPLNKRGNNGLNERAEASGKEGRGMREEGHIGDLVGLVLSAVQASGGDGFGVHTQLMGRLLDSIVGAGAAEGDPCCNEVGGLAISQIENFAAEGNKFREHAKFIHGVIKIELIESEERSDIVGIEVRRVGSCSCSVGPIGGRIETGSYGRVCCADPAGWWVLKERSRHNIIPLFDESDVRRKIREGREKGFLFS